TGPGWSLAFVAIAVRDRAHARRRHQALESRGQVVHAALQVVDDALHAAGRVDHDRDVDAHLAEPADVLSERRAERPAGAAAPAGPEPADAGARRGEARAETPTLAARRHGRGRVPASSTIGAAPATPGPGPG